MRENDADALGEEHGKPVKAEATDVVGLIDDDEDLVLRREPIDVDTKGLEVQLQGIVELRDRAQGGRILRGDDV